MDDMIIDDFEIVQREIVNVRKENADNDMQT
jgi:hypothetical protein